MKCLTLINLRKIIFSTIFTLFLPLLVNASDGLSLEMFYEKEEDYGRTTVALVFAVVVSNMTVDMNSNDIKESMDNLLPIIVQLLEDKWDPPAIIKLLSNRYNIRESFLQDMYFQYIELSIAEAAKT